MNHDRPRQIHPRYFVIVKNVEDVTETLKLNVLYSFASVSLNYSSSLKVCQLNNVNSSNNIPPNITTTME